MKKVTETTKKTVALNSTRTYESLSVEEKAKLNKELEFLIKENKKLSNNNFAIISTNVNVEIEDIKSLYLAIKARLKEEKSKLKLDNWKLKNCSFEYKSKEFSFNPRFVVENDKKIVVFKSNLDKNAIYCVHQKKEGNIEILAFPCVSETSKSFEFRKKLVTSNKTLVTHLFEEMLNGVSFEVFLRRCENFRGWKEVTLSKGILDMLHKKIY